MADNNFYTPGGVVGACEAERLQYYGDANAIPSDASLFSFTTDSETMTASIKLKEEFIQDSTLTKIVIPYKYVNSNNEEFAVTSIGDNAFYDCSSLTSINIPNSVTSIGNGAFSCCQSLTNITIPNSVTSIGGGVFEYCSSLTSINIPDSVISIGNAAFSGCSSLTSINIPDSVISIGSEAFVNCYKLTILCAEGSYADSYAKENGIAVEYIN